MEAAIVPEHASLCQPGTARLLLGDRLSRLPRDPLPGVTFAGPNSPSWAYGRAAMDGDYVLLVDDDPGCRQLLTAIFRASGIEARSAIHGEDALAQLREASRLPSLILLDLSMPVMDGRAFRAAQVADERLRSVPVLLLSACHDLERCAVELGVPYLEKPVHVRELVELARRHAGQEV